MQAENEDMATAIAPNRRVVANETEGGALDAAIQETSTRKKRLTEMAGDFLGVHPSKVMDFLRTHVFRVKQNEEPFSDPEMFAALSLIGRYGLDPVTREIYLMRDKQGRVSTIIGVDGWMKVLHNTPGYDGFDQEYGWKGGEEGGQLLWVETRVYHKDRSHPVVYRAFMTEWAQNQSFSQWGPRPFHMLTVRSLCHAARRFASVGVALAEDEFEEMLRAQEREEHHTSRMRNLADAAGVDQPESQSDVIAEHLKKRRTEPQRPPERTVEAESNEADSPADDKPSPFDPHGDPELTDQLCSKLEAASTELKALGVIQELSAVKARLTEAEFSHVSELGQKRLAALKQTKK